MTKVINEANFFISDNRDIVNVFPERFNIPNKKIKI